MITMENRHPSYFLIIVLLLATTTISQHHCQYALAKNVPTSTYKARVISIIDGDSLELLSDRGSVTIRLWGIDSPEWDQPFSDSAKHYVKDLLFNKEVVVEPYYTDAYDRTVAQIFLFGKSLNQILIEKGLAWVHVYYCDRHICSYWRELEARARQQELGLWSAQNPTPPWIWKKNH